MDLFSLGVLAFELWSPFGTAMERILTLKELRLRGQPLHYVTASLAMCWVLGCSHIWLSNHSISEVRPGVI